jgi:hypothetical protein
MSRVGFVVFVIFGVHAMRAFSFEQWDFQVIENVHGEKYHELRSQGDKAECRVDWRLAITESTLSFLYRIENKGNINLVFCETMPHLYDATKKRHFSGSLTGNDSGREVPVGEDYTWRRSVSFMLSDIKARGLNGHLTCMRWGILSKWAPAIWIVFPNENGKIELVISLSEEKAIHLMLAAVYKSGGLDEIACILINQTDSTVLPENMKIENSIRIQALDLEKEYILPVSPNLDLKSEVASGGHQIWRLPWRMVLDAINGLDIKPIRETGVRINLTWRLGTYESPLLPIAIMPPTKRESER